MADAIVRRLQERPEGVRSGLVAFGDFLERRPRQSWRLSSNYVSRHGVASRTDLRRQFFSRANVGRVVGSRPTANADRRGYPHRRPRSFATRARRFKLVPLLSSRDDDGNPLLMKSFLFAPPAKDFMAQPSMLYLQIGSALPTEPTHPIDPPACPSRVPIRDPLLLRGGRLLTCVRRELSPAQLRRCFDDVAPLRFPQPRQPFPLRIKAPRQRVDDRIRRSMAEDFGGQCLAGGCAIGVPAPPLLARSSVPASSNKRPAPGTTDSE